MRLRMTVLCIPEGCHSVDIDSTDVGENAQDLYNSVWDAHDEMCRASCGCKGKVSLIVDYERQEPYERQRVATLADREASA